ncbi:MAG: FecR domain-containing protein [Cyclobacteriaceae bacterium]
MENNPDKETLLARWLADDLTPEERKAIGQDKSFEALKAVTEDISSWQLPAMDIDKGLQRLRAAQTKEEKKTVQLQSFGHAMRIAAAVTLLIVGYVGWQLYFSGDQVYETGIAQRLDIELPDESMVALDAGSRLSYDPSDWDNSRSLVLHGEAYFDVAKGSKFSVETSAGTVTVLGTQFNVRHFPGILAVTCFEGSVQVVSDDESIVLKPSDGVVFDEGEMSTFITDNALPDWQQGYTRFSRSNLIRVVKELERRFKARINLPVKYHDLKYSGAVPFTSLEEALQSVFVPMELEYRIDNDGNVSIL